MKDFYIIYLLSSEGDKFWGERHSDLEVVKELTNDYNSTRNKENEFYFYQKEF